MFLKQESKLTKILLREKAFIIHIISKQICTVKVYKKSDQYKNCGSKANAVQYPQIENFSIVWKK